MYLPEIICRGGEGANGLTGILFFEIELSYFSKLFEEWWGKGADWFTIKEEEVEWVLSSKIQLFIAWLIEYSEGIYLWWALDSSEKEKFIKSVVFEWEML